jgi:hypothetical protein
MKLTDDELRNVRNANAELQNYKLKLGELELHKAALLSRVERVQFQFEALEKELVEKYGADAVIDIKTGEVKHDGKD